MMGGLHKVRPLEGPDSGWRDSGLAQRLGGFLRETHPHHTAKGVMNDLAVVGEFVGAETVKNWVAGEKWPSWPSHLDALLRAYGEAFSLAVFGPSLCAAEDLEEQKLARAEREIAARRAQLDAARQHRRTFLGKI